MQINPSNISTSIIQATKKAISQCQKKEPIKALQNLSGVDIFQFSSKLNEKAYKNSDTYNGMLQLFVNNPIEKELGALEKLKNYIINFTDNMKNLITDIDKDATVEELSSLLAYQRDSLAAMPALVGKINNSANDFICKNLQNLLHKNHINRDMILYRGIKRGEILNEGDFCFSNFSSGIPFDEFKQLTHYKFPGYASTSIMPDVAYEFGENNAVVARIIAPKGTKGLYVPEYMDIMINANKKNNFIQKKSHIFKSISEKFLLSQKKAASTEREFLLPANTTFRILKHHDLNGLKIIDAIVENQ